MIPRPQPAPVTVGEWLEYFAVVGNGHVCVQRRDKDRTGLWRVSLTVEIDRLQVVSQGAPTLYGACERVDMAIEEFRRGRQINAGTDDGSRWNKPWDAFQAHVNGCLHCGGGEPHELCRHGGELVAAVIAEMKLSSAAAGSSDEKGARK